MSIRLLLTVASSSRGLYRAFAQKSSPLPLLDSCLRVARDHLRGGNLFATFENDVVRVKTQLESSEITLSRKAKEEHGVSFVMLSIRDFNPDFPATTAALFHAITIIASERIDFVTINVMGIDKARREFLQSFLKCKVLSATEYLIPETTRNSIRNIWSKSL